MIAAPAISVVVPTFQRCAPLRRLLEALRQQTLAPEQYEVIVSIDGSDDGTREMVAQFQSPYRLRSVWNPNRGRAAACNAGIRIASGELLVLLDDDMEPVPDFLAAHHKAHGQESELGLVGAAPMRLSGDQALCGTFRYVANKFNGHMQKLSQAGYPLALRDFYSGNFSIRRHLLMAVGLFDEAFTAYGNEDLELFWRLSKSGVCVRFSAEAVAHQSYGKNVKELAQDNMAKGSTAVVLAAKHPQAATALKLGEWGAGSVAWRALRAFLIRAGLWLPPLPRLVIGSMRWCERRDIVRLDRLYPLLTSYCYWLGVHQALREMKPDEASELTQWIKATQP